MSETPIDVSEARQLVIRSLELRLQILDHGFGMPRDPDAIVRTKALLEEARAFSGVLAARTRIGQQVD
jgi:hypothetical protein